MQLTLHTTRRTPHGAASHLVQTAFAWPVVLRAGIVGRRGSTVIRLRPCMTWVHPLYSHARQTVIYENTAVCHRRQCTSAPSARERQRRLEPSPFLGTPTAVTRPSPYLPSRYLPAVSPTRPLHPEASACNPPGFAVSLLAARGEEKHRRTGAQEAGDEGIRREGGSVRRVCWRYQAEPIEVA